MSVSKNMKLYLNLMSTNSRRAALPVYHLNAKVEFITVDFQSDFLEKPEFTKINPMGMLPALTDGDFGLSESCAIQQYVCDQTPNGNTIYPKETKVRADINRWQFWAVAHLGQWTGTLQWENMMKAMFGMGHADTAKVTEAMDEFKNYATCLDHHLSNCTYLVGNTLSIADFAVASELAYWKEAKMPLNDFPHALKWFEKVQSTDAWKKSSPSHK